jgi:hypothetical protein
MIQLSRTANQQVRQAELNDAPHADEARPDHLIPYCRAALGYISDNVCFSTFGW